MCFFILHYYYDEVSNSRAEINLVRNLLNDYEESVRPTLDPHKAISVNIRLELIVQV
jgi:hypothetical protein